MKMNTRLAILFSVRTLGIFALCRLLTRSKLRILCYHAGNLGDETQFNPKLFLSAATLERRMLWLKRKGFNVVSLDNAMTEMEGDGGTGTRNPLRTVITFDDGWHSTASTLIPVLSRLKMPSTLYLCTKHFLEGWPVLNVTVRYILWKSPVSDPHLVGSGIRTRDNNELEAQTAREEFAKSSVDSIEASAQTRDEVCIALEKFAISVGVPPEELQLQTRRFDYMSRDALLAIAAQDCSIELHGHVHDYPSGDAAKFKKDLETCTDTIVGIGLPKPKHYCYPSGEFDDDASSVLADYAVVSATTCIPGLVSNGDKARRHYLPRFLDGENIHMLEFEAELSGFSDIVRRCVR